MQMQTEKEREKMDDSPLNRAKILIVDDDPGAQNGIKAAPAGQPL